VAKPDAGKVGHVRLSRVPLSYLRPAPENETLYRPVTPDDSDIVALADSIRQHGVREPIVMSKDGYILSGHRRYVAAGVAGLVEVPCRIENVWHDDEPDRFLTLLREFNRQREKTLEEKLREEVVSADPVEAYESLIDFRKKRSEITVKTLVLGEGKARRRITDAKRPLLDAAKRIVFQERRAFWPLTVRMIHYAILNDPPLRHAKKPGSIYRNDLDSYKDLDDLLTRARLTGEIPMEAIEDETRPVALWNVYPTAQVFVRKELGSFLKGYWRDLMQSQHNHVEILAEKNTVVPMVRPVASDYCIPLTSGRGFASLPPRANMAERFRKSGKDKLIVLFVTDFDPSGEEICTSYARSMRDDFGVAVEAVKVALTGEQVARFKLPPKMKAKKDDPNYRKFRKAHGKNAYEIEALEPALLQQLLREAVDSVIDVEAFNRELAQEREDAAFLDYAKRRALAALHGMGIDREGEEEDE
jgi:hypothetical protein